MKTQLKEAAVEGAAAKASKLGMLRSPSAGGRGWSRRSGKEGLAG